MSCREPTAAALLAALVLHAAAAALAHADDGAPGPALKRLTRPVYEPKRSPTDGGLGDLQNNLDGPDDRVRVRGDAHTSRLPSGTVIDGRAFARFGVCTATHLGRGVYLTGGHCIDQQLGLVGFRSSPCPYVLSRPLGGGRVDARCNVIAFGYTATDDYAILELVDPGAAAELPMVPVDYAFDWPTAKARWVRLYGYSGDTLRMNVQCEARFDAKSGRVLHNCDTEPGDSGSALIDVMTGYVIGVHAGGLKPRGNYAYPIERVPWAQSLCVALDAGAAAPLALPRGGATASLRVSTSHLALPYRRITLLLNGRSPRANTRIRVRAPGVDLDVDPAWLRWSGTQWSWKEVFALEDASPGPWSVDVAYTATPRNALKSGHVQGRVWVCP